MYPNPITTYTSCSTRGGQYPRYQGIQIDSPPRYSLLPQQVNKLRYFLFTSYFLLRYLIYLIYLIATWYFQKHTRLVDLTLTISTIIH